MIKSLFCLLLTLTLSFSSVAATKATAPDLIDRVDPSELKMHLSFLASKELGGRYTLAPNFKIAARYLATRLQAYGYQGAAADGGYFQNFDVISARVKPSESSLTFETNGNRQIYPYGEFFNAGTEGMDGQADVVFVGYGISSPKLKRDDYEGLDVKGKIVVALAAYPKGIDSSRISEDEKGAGAAQKHGALAIVFLPRVYELQAMRRPTYVQRTLEGVRLALDTNGENLPTLRLGPDAADQVLRSADLSLQKVMAAARTGSEVEAKPLNARMAIRLAVDKQTVTTQNVAAVLPGTDAKLKDEYVLFSAHYDHLETDRNGEIFPGADDDGSGTSGVLNIAKVVAEKPSKRSVMVVFHAGEELGLLGSKYNADFAPLVSLEKIVVNINIDMIGRSRPNDLPRNKQMTDKETIYAIGLERNSKELYALNEKINASTVKLRLDYELNNPAHPDQIYFRSDHWNYGKHGVPFVFYFDGVGEDYHQPTDTEDKIDYTKLSQVTKLALALGWQIANMDHRLSKNVP